MPESRLARTRATLPSGYQFGDAAARRRGEFGAATVLGKICERCGNRSIERDERGEFCFVCDNGEAFPA